jgi:hypothetical protein
MNNSHRYRKAATDRLYKEATYLCQYKLCICCTQPYSQNFFCHPSYIVRLFLHGRSQVRALSYMTPRWQDILDTALVAHAD